MCPSGRELPAGRPLVSARYVGLSGRSVLGKGLTGRFALTTIDILPRVPA